MKKCLLFALLTFSLLSRLSAQDVIYTASGNRLPDARLISATEDKVTFTVQQRTLSFQRQTLLVAFSHTGNFQIISELSVDPVQAQQQIQAYLSTPIITGDYDYLVKLVPLSVIPAKISYESDVAVNYKTHTGSSASISTNELAMILYHDGKHKLLRDAADVVGLLPEVRKKIKEPDTTQTQPASIASPTVPRSESLTVIPQPAITSPALADTADPKIVININNSPASPKPAPEPTTPLASADNASAKPSLNEANYQSYRAKALQKVDEFVSYLNIITDKKLSSDEKDKAVRQASKLFMPAATIEVTSKTRPGSRRYPIGEYLNRLKLLPYSSAKIEWSEVQYLKELSQAADGNYYGVITGQQTFMGYGNQGDKPIYSDVTQKRVRVKLESYEKLVDGKSNINWNVLLGNIGVAAQ